MSTDYTYMHAKDHGKISGCCIHIFQQASAVTLVDIIDTLCCIIQMAYADDEIRTEYEPTFTS